MDTPSIMTIQDNQAAKIYQQLIAYAENHPDLRCHLLIDPALRDAQQQWNAIAPDLHSRRTPITIHESLFPAGHRPCLYALDLTLPTDQAVLEDSVRLMLEDWTPDAALLGEGHRICAWLWTQQDVTPSDLAQHLGRQAVQYDLARNGRILLRYFDPRVLDLLWQALTDEQQAILLSPAHAWHFIDRTSSLQTLFVHRHNSPSTSKLNLNERQWSAIRCVGLINQALMRVQVERQRPPHPTAAQDAESALYRAQMYGLHDEHDLIEFAYLAMTLHPRFDVHPSMRPILDAVRDGENFIETMQRLSPQQTHQIDAMHRH